MKRELGIIHQDQIFDSCDKYYGYLFYESSVY